MVICTDSTAVLASMLSFHSNSRQGLLYEVLQSVTGIVVKGCEIKFLWVPAHVGVKGNESADKMAKKAIKKLAVEMNVKISKSEVKSMIWERVNVLWQEKWNNEVKGRHLYCIQNSIGTKKVMSGDRRKEIVLTRLRLGHSALNKSLHIIGKHQSGFCEVCHQEDETIEHVLQRCRRYDTERETMRYKMRELGEQEVGMKTLLRMENWKHVRVLIEFLKIQDYLKGSRIWRIMSREFH